MTPSSRRDADRPRQSPRPRRIGSYEDAPPSAPSRRRTTSPWPERHRERPGPRGPQRGVRDVFGHGPLCWTSCTIRRSRTASAPSSFPAAAGPPRWVTRPPPSRSPTRSGCTCRRSPRRAPRSIIHRATPTFRYPAQLEDAQRAARFVRANAARYSIDPSRIGGAGVKGSDHGPTFPGAINPPDYKGEMVKWFDVYLRK